MCRAVLSLILLVCISFSYPAAHAEPRRVSILPGDANSRLAMEAARDLMRNDPEFRRIAIRVFPGKDPRARDLEHLRRSDLALVLIMGRAVVDAVRLELDEVVRRGGRVYGFGGILDEDLRKRGIALDSTIQAYYEAGGPENMRNMILSACGLALGVSSRPTPIKALPDSGIYDWRSGEILTDFSVFAARRTTGRARLGILFNRNTVSTGHFSTLLAICRKIEAEGYEAVPVFGYPAADAIEAYLLDESGAARVRAILALSMKVGTNPQTTGPTLERLGVPVLNAITLNSLSRVEWESSVVGLDIMERAWQVAVPELGGLIQPTVVATRENVRDGASGAEWVEDQPVPERVERLVARGAAWLNLQSKPNSEKRVAVIYYNYPPGKQNIGASYLNVMPRSLWRLRESMREAGYTIERPSDAARIDSADSLAAEIITYGRGLGRWAPAELEALARSGRPVLLPVAEYARWFRALPATLRKAVEEDWGPPEKASIMTWRDDRGELFLVLPAVRSGNILFMPQSTRGWEEDPAKLYHDIHLAPHHQYIAFYLWLKKRFRADAVMHIGTHGTHEWLSGREVGFTADDPPEALIADLPNIYPYIVDDVGEGLQAKRRGMAVVVDHMTPPFAAAGLAPELAELQALIADYARARELSPPLAAARAREIGERAARHGILLDLGIKADTALPLSNEAIEEIEHHIKGIGEKMTPFGLHTLGVAPGETLIVSTARAMAGETAASVPSEERDSLAGGFERLIRISAEREIASIIDALDGRYVAAGPGNDPLRNPASLPTGRNFFSFDPSRIPSPAAYRVGERLARELVEGFKARHGRHPRKLAFNLWGVETIRHEGIMESEIMNLMGVRPKWDSRGRVVGVELIPREKLGRPRIDVTVVPSGLHRDLFSNLIKLLDDAVTLAAAASEEDNLLRANTLRTAERLRRAGVDTALAGRLSGVRLFTVPSGAYGTNLDKVIPISNSWDSEAQVAGVFFMRMSHLYGQGFWGANPADAGAAAALDSRAASLGDALLRNAFTGAEMAVHSRSGNLYASLDNDDFFQYLGGTAMAIRAVNGVTPEVYVVNLADPANPRQETIERYMGREMRARYLNPEWITKMLDEGYAGARFVDKVVEHLWGWQVTVPEAVGAAKWNELHEVYVLDRHGLDLRRRFREAGNGWALQSILGRMLETIRKGYWQPEPEVVETLAREYAREVEDLGLACCDHTCNNPALAEFITRTLVAVPGLEPRAAAIEAKLAAIRSERPRARQGESRRKAAPPPVRSAARPSISAPNSSEPSANAPEPVIGYELEPITPAEGASAPIPWLFLAGFAGIVCLIAAGWRRG